MKAKALKLLMTLFGLLALIVLLTPAKFASLALLHVDPVPDTKKYVEDGQYFSAVQYLGFFMDYEYVKEDPEAVELYEKIEEVRSSWSYKAKKLSEGLLTGSSDESYGNYAGIASDFLVIGDIRDLSSQAYNHATGDETDGVIATLAAIGLAASVAQGASAVATVGSAGAAAPAFAGATYVKASVSFLKLARKLSKMPKWLVDRILKVKDLANNSDKFTYLKSTLADVYAFSKVPGGLTLLNKTTGPASLKKMSNFINKISGNSLVVYKLGGDLAVNAAQQSKQFTKQTIELASTYGTRGFRALNKLGEKTFLKITKSKKVINSSEWLAEISGFILSIYSSVLALFSFLTALLWLPVKGAIWLAAKRTVKRIFNKKSTQSV